VARPVLSSWGMDTRTSRIRLTLEVALLAVVLVSLAQESNPKPGSEARASLACLTCYVDSTAYADPYVCFRLGKLVLIED